MLKKLFIKKQTTEKTKQIRIIWLHGWQQNHKALLPLAKFFDNIAINYLIDLPGFGKSQIPDSIWGSKDYGDNIAKWLSTKTKIKTIIVGFSFGCRVAMQLALHHKTLVDRIILIAAPGIKRKRSILFIIKAFILKKASKLLKIIDLLLGTTIKAKFSEKVGSTDYKNAGNMRPILVKTINEDLSQIAKKIQQQVLLIFGQQDNETPIEFGRYYNNIIMNSKLIELPNFNHFTILSLGKYQIQNLIMKFIKDQ